MPSNDPLTPRPSAPVDPQAVLESLDSMETEEKIDALEELLGSLSRDLSRTQG